MPGDAVGDDQVADAIASNLGSYGHPVATAPMGGPRDAWAVVDSGGAVKGIDRLRVVDASIMPCVPSVALNPTVLMIAERIAKTVYAAGLDAERFDRDRSGRRALRRMGRGVDNAATGCLAPGALTGPSPMNAPPD